MSLCLFLGLCYMSRFWFEFWLCLVLCSCFESGYWFVSGFWVLGLVLV